MAIKMIMTKLKRKFYLKVNLPIHFSTKKKDHKIRRTNERTTTQWYNYARWQISFFFSFFFRVVFDEYNLIESNAVCLMASIWNNSINFFLSTKYKRKWFFFMKSNTSVYFKTILFKSMAKSNLNSLIDGDTDTYT